MAFLALGGGEGKHGDKVEVWVDQAQVDQMLERLALALSPVSIGMFLFEEVEPYLQKRAEDRFKSEGDAASGRWSALAEWTQEERDLLGYGPKHPIQQRTGDLMEAVSSARGEVVSDGATSELTWPGIGDTGSDLTSIKYAVAQTGRGPAGKSSGQPARPVAVVDVTDLQEVLFTLEEHIMKALSPVAGGALTALFGGM